MKYEGKMEKLQDKMREKGERSYLSGSALIVYGRDKYYGIFSGVEYANLVAKRTVKSTIKEIARELEKMLVEKASKKKITFFFLVIRSVAAQYRINLLPLLATF